MKKIIRFILSNFLALTLCFIVLVKGHKEVKKQKEQADKFSIYYLLMNLWIKKSQQGKKVEEYLQKKNYYKVAIYGLAEMGEVLIGELKNTEIEIIYGIDKRVNGIKVDIPVCSLKDELKEVDAIIVTPTVYFNSIEKELREKISCPIISLEEIIFNM